MIKYSCETDTASSSVHMHGQRTFQICKSYQSGYFLFRYKNPHFYHGVGRLQVKRDPKQFGIEMLQPEIVIYGVSWVFNQLIETNYRALALWKRIYRCQYSWDYDQIKAFIDTFKAFLWLLCPYIFTYVFINWLSYGAPSDWLVFLPLKDNKDIHELIFYESIPLYEWLFLIYYSAMI